MFYFAVLLVFILGTCVGSFLNVLAYRSVHGDPNQKKRSDLDTVILGRSLCPNCGHQLSWKDLIPLLSFLLLSGKCRYCGRSISFQYPLVEASSGLLFAYAAQSFFSSSTFSFEGLTLGLINLIFVLFVISVLIALFVTDLRDGLLPNSIVLPAIVITLLFKLFFLFFLSDSVSNLFSDSVSISISISSLLYDLLASFIIGGVFFLIVYLTNERAMGGGDVKLAFLIGLILGWPLMIVGLFLAFLTGGLLAAMLLLIGKKRFGQTVPLGPFLCLGALIALFWGQELANLYLSAFS